MSMLVRDALLLLAAAAGAAAEEWPVAYTGAECAVEYQLVARSTAGQERGSADAKPSDPGARSLAASVGRRPDSGVDRSCDRPCLGHLRWPLCSRWRPSTPSFALLLLQSVLPSRLVSFGTLWLPFLCFLRVQGPGGCFRGGGACQRACSSRRRYPDERVFVRVRALFISSPRVCCHSFLWKLALHAGPAATGGV